MREQYARLCMGPSPSPPYSAAVVNAISLYMRHLGVRSKSGDKKSGRNFFRKKVLPRVPTPGPFLPRDLPLRSLKILYP